jgi:hypothetical protein
LIVVGVQVKKENVLILSLLVMTNTIATRSVSNYLQMPMTRMENPSLKAFIKRVEDEEGEEESGEKQGWTADWGEAEWRLYGEWQRFPFGKKRGLLIYLTFPFFHSLSVTSQNFGVEIPWSQTERSAYCVSRTEAPQPI